MNVQLYVYDLTRGMARTMSRQLIGVQLDAVYHTALVFNRVEYFFGRGIQTCRPGATHHGQPMEIIAMGTTHLPMDTILEYLESLKDIYSPESYDLFAHNCNNFTNDFGMFLVGKGIPDHITNLPRRVLDTPMGQMLKAQIDSSMRAITQAPAPPESRVNPATANGTSTRPAQSSPVAAVNGTSVQKQSAYGSAINVTDKAALDKHLLSASNSAATIFFTSSTCAPCKIAYPMFDRLAEQYPHALFIKVDIGNALDIASNYHIRATPAFVTFSKGARQDSWSGADPNLLKSNVDNLMQTTFPPHPHTSLKLPTLQCGSLKPVTYVKKPPMDKLMVRLGTTATDKNIVALRSFIDKREVDPRTATLPDLRSVGTAFQTKVLALPVEVRFAAIDLLRCAMVDPRVGGFFAEEQPPQTISAIVQHVTELQGCPHNLRLVTIHLACNLFLSPLYIRETMQEGSKLVALVIQVVTSSLFDASHPTTRVAAASLAFNLAVSNYRIRREETREALGESEQVELAASLLEALSREENSDAVKALLLALGYLVYCAPREGELMDLTKALDAKSIVDAVKGQDSLAKEVASLL